MVFQMLLLEYEFEFEFRFVRIFSFNLLREDQLLSLMLLSPLLAVDVAVVLLRSPLLSTLMFCRCGRCCLLSPLLAVDGVHIGRKFKFEF